MRDINRILVYRIGHLGDTLVSLPAFWAIRRSYPNAHITLLTNSNTNNPNYILARSVLPENGLFDDWMSYPDKTDSWRDIYNFGKLFVNLHKKKFDAVFYLTTRNRVVAQIKRDILFFRTAGIKRVIGTEYLLKNLLDSNASRPLPFVETEKDFLLNCLSEDIPLQSVRDLKPELRQ